MFMDQCRCLVHLYDDVETSSWLIYLVEYFCLKMLKGVTFTANLTSENLLLFFNSLTMIDPIVVNIRNTKDHLSKWVPVIMIPYDQSCVIL